MQSSSRLSLAALALILVAAAWLRAPGVSFGMPYFYDEDEAHHFNRVAEMVKRGEYNPRYFHKPSLHFYLRMPVVAGSFLWSVKEGHIRSVKEIKTRDEAGVGGYAFSASHPGIVKANRALSVSLWLVAIVLAYSISHRLFPRAPAAGPIAALICALSPELVRHASTIGVDGLMSVMCLAATCAALVALESRKVASILFAAFIAGLAISSKYNALPIAAAPILASLAARPKDLFCHAAALCAIAVGFFAGTPYAIPELPLFLDQFAYEIWHYGIAGHEGHTGEPGLGQALFYTRWLKHEAFGSGAMALAAIGLFTLPLTAGDRRLAKAVVFLSFPVLFFILMCSQRANFTRNMLVLLPYLAILAGGAPAALSGVIGKSAAGRALIGIALVAAAAQPMAGALALRSELASAPAESRVELDRYLSTLPSGKEMAIDSELELPPGALARRGVEETPLADLDGAALWAAGFDEVAAGPAASAKLRNDPGATLIRTIDGNPEATRITRDPRILIFALEPANDRFPESGARFEPIEGRPGAFSCEPKGRGFARDAAEPHCWITERRVRVTLPTSVSGPIELDLMSPWPAPQPVEITTGAATHRLELGGAKAGQWITVELSGETASHLDLSVSAIHSATELGTGEDPRRLGVAVGELRTGL